MNDIESLIARVEAAGGGVRLHRGRVETRHVPDDLRADLSANKAALFDHLRRARMNDLRDRLAVLYGPEWSLPGTKAERLVIIRELVALS
jgi:hypothetical protein